MIKKELPRATLPILVDGRVRTIHTDVIRDKDFRDALSLGIAQLVHEGRLKLDDILAE